jgi:hypothetical protein
MKQSKQSSIIRKSPLIASLALACALGGFSTNAFAFGKPVFDWKKFTQDAAEFKETVAHRVKEVTHMAQEIPKVANMVNADNLGMQGTPLDNITQRSLSYGIERCDQGGGGGFDIKSLLGGLIPSSNGNFVEKQKDICQKIVTLENAKYNDLVDGLKALQELKKDGLGKNTANAEGLKEKGQADVTQISATNMVGQLQVVSARIETNQRIYDGMIASLNQDMKTAAEEALRGKKKNLGESLLSGAISMVTLKGVLEGLKSSCPSGFDCG